MVRIQLQDNGPLIRYAKSMRQGQYFLFYNLLPTSKFSPTHITSDNAIPMKMCTCLKESWNRRCCVFYFRLGEKALRCGRAANIWQFGLPYYGRRIPLSVDHGGGGGLRRLLEAIKDLLSIERAQKICKLSANENKISWRPQNRWLAGSVTLTRWRNDIRSCGSPHFNDCFYGSPWT